MISANLKMTLANIIHADKDLNENERRVLLAVFETDSPILYADDELITGKQAAEILKVTQGTICNLAKAGVISRIRRTARKIFYVRSEIERKLAGLPAKRGI